MEKVDDVEKDKNVLHAIMINRKILSHLWKPHLGIMSLKTMDVEKGVLEENRGELSIKTGNMSNIILHLNYHLNVFLAQVESAG